MLSRRELLQLIMSSAALTACGSDTTLNPKTVDGGSDNSDGGGEVPEPGEPDLNVDFTVPDSWDYPAVEALLPFGHGVASGDPLADRVILWTRITVPDERGWRVEAPQGLREVSVYWAIATDPDFQQIVGSGEVVTDRQRDWTVKIDAAGLASATTYYYAFAALGRSSPIGRTRTAPKAGDRVDDLRIAHASCSSYWNMDFHPYARIAERNDLDLFCHAGDYVYEFVDSKGWYRARNDRFDLDYVDFRHWHNRDECCRRYALYYSDPDLLRAHQSVAFAIMPDQHDFDDQEDPETGVLFSQSDAAEVFWLWTPSRPPLPDGSGEFGPPPAANEQVAAPAGEQALLDYRYLPYGDLADVVLIDIRRFRDDSAASEMGKLLGDRQTEWLKQLLLASANTRQARFRIIVNQINMSQLGTTESIPFLETLFGSEATGPELYTNGWGGYIASRREFYGFLREQGIVDNIVFSGDSHGWFAHDLIEDPSLPSYVPAIADNGPAGTLQTVGVELVPSSMGRPGGGEVVAGALYEAAEGGPVHDDYETFRQRYLPLGETAVRVLEGVAPLANNNLRYFNWRTYGYGLTHLTDDRHVMELWEVPAPVRSDEQTLIRQFDNRRGNPGLLERGPFSRVATVGLRQDLPAPAPELPAVFTPVV
ncbi:MULTISPECIES: alkaline phosphatase D family protein [Spongiibacter]|uniref:alkaline phosphatase D family protein n=1 Tax=Spongiibacter TaxID=630749 RepID=UPI0023545A97|nr:MULTISPECIES: alkaline phosphatase D family protein [Spongiibacter]|tara:strand:+ start:3648 stop:5600 length:1953 start_codon:yes stop_codon:yes gene_type:complete